MHESLPIIRAETVDRTGCVTLQLLVPTDLKLFAGHFPGLPLLPGVVQINWVACLGMPRFRIHGGFTRLLNIKFQKPILPGCALDLIMHWDASRQQLAFNYTSPAGCHASGKIEFATTHPADGT